MCAIAPKAKGRLACFCRLLLPKFCKRGGVVPHAPIFLRERGPAVPFFSFTVWVDAPATPLPFWWKAMGGLDHKSFSLVFAGYSYPSFVSEVGRDPTRLS